MVNKEILDVPEGTRPAFDNRDAKCRIFLSPALAQLRAKQVAQLTPKSPRIVAVTFDWML